MLENLLLAQREELQQLRELRKESGATHDANAAEAYINSLHSPPVLVESQVSPTTKFLNRPAKNHAKDMDYLMRVKNVNNFITTSNSPRPKLLNNDDKNFDFLHHPALSLSLSKMVSGSATSDAPSLMFREKQYASEMDSFLHLANLNKETTERREGQLEAKVDEISRNLFNAMEALSEERNETNRVKIELIAARVECDELNESFLELSGKLQRNMKVVEERDLLARMVEELEQKIDDNKKLAEVSLRAEAEQWETKIKIMEAQTTLEAKVVKEEVAVLVKNNELLYSEVKELRLAAVAAAASKSISVLEETGVEAAVVNGENEDAADGSENFNLHDNEADNDDVKSIEWEASTLCSNAKKYKNTWKNSDDDDDDSGAKEEEEEEEKTLNLFDLALSSSSSTTNRNGNRLIPPAEVQQLLLRKTRIQIPLSQPKTTILYKSPTKKNKKGDGKIRAEEVTVEGGGESEGVGEGEVVTPTPFVLLSPPKNMRRNHDVSHLVMVPSLNQTHARQRTPDRKGKGGKKPPRPSSSQGQVKKKIAKKKSNRI